MYTRQEQDIAGTWVSNRYFQSTPSRPCKLQVNTFKRFLASKSVTIEGLNTSFLSDPSGDCYIAVMDKSQYTSPTSREAMKNFLRRIGFFILGKRRSVYSDSSFCIEQSWNTGYISWRTRWRSPAWKKWRKNCEESCIVNETGYSITYGTPLHDWQKSKGLPGQSTCMPNVAYIRSCIWFIACPYARPVR